MANGRTAKKTNTYKIAVTQLSDHLSDFCTRILVVNNFSDFFNCPKKKKKCSDSVEKTAD